MASNSAGGYGSAHGFRQPVELRFAVSPHGRSRDRGRQAAAIAGAATGLPARRPRHGVPRTRTSGRAAMSREWVALREERPAPGHAPRGAKDRLAAQTRYAPQRNFNRPSTPIAESVLSAGSRGAHL